MNNNKTPISPSLGPSRIALLDIFRGFALLGIFVVNIRYMSSSVIYPNGFSWMKEGVNNSIAWWLLEQFFNSKFFPIFSFMFGVGFGMQINKMEEKGTFTSMFFIRRYGILFVFGLLHIVFIWGGDVLALYAIAGMLVLLIRRLTVRYILILSLLILIFPFYGHILHYIDRLFIHAGFPSILTLKDYSYQDIVAINIDGSFIDNLKFRLSEYSVYYRSPEYFPLLIAMIFIGYSAGKLKFYKKIPETLAALKWYALFSIPFILAVHYLHSNLVYDKTDFKWYILMTKIWTISNVLQAFLYLYIISWLHHKKYLLPVLEPLAYAGRMSLTNYIMQSLIGFILFNGLFIGLYGTLGNAWLGLISVIVYIILIIASKYWLRYFRFGPLEWIWRQLTYNTILSIITNNKTNNIKTIES